jgi:hypothetical protein
VRKLTHSQIKEVRDQMLVAQRGKCALCRLPMTPRQIVVLDHDHATGAVRAALHHSCNALLGKVENNAGRFGVAGHLIEWCMGLGAYLQAHKTNITGMIHPTHLTEDEKRVKKNEKARKARVTARKVKA